MLLNIKDSKQRDKSPEPKIERDINSPKELYRVELQFNEEKQDKVNALSSFASTPNRRQ